MFLRPMRLQCLKELEKFDYRCLYHVSENNTLVELKTHRAWKRVQQLLEGPWDTHDVDWVWRFQILFLERLGICCSNSMRNCKAYLIWWQGRRVDLKVTANYLYTEDIMRDCGKLLKKPTKSSLINASWISDGISVSIGAKVSKTLELS